jgi:hypothetical protein
MVGLWKIAIWVSMSVIEDEVGPPCATGVNFVEIQKTVVDLLNLKSRPGPINGRLRQRNHQARQ